VVGVTCPRCSGPSQLGLCRECELEELDDYFSKRGEHSNDLAGIDEDSDPKEESDDE